MCGMWMFTAAIVALCVNVAPLSRVVPSHRIVRPIYIHLCSHVLAWQRFVVCLLSAAIFSRQPCDILVLGSSVAAGYTQSGPVRGWVQQLANELESRPKVVNEAIAGSNSWNAWVVLTASLLRWRPKIVILSYSIANEGLFLVLNAWLATAIVERFVSVMPRLVLQAERAGAKVIITSAYPRASYQPIHLTFLNHVHHAMSQMHCAAFVNFLEPLGDGRGKWRKHLQADPAHPNERGHAIMCEVARPAVERVLCTLE